MQFEIWRKVLCTIYGKRAARSKWMLVAVDLQAVAYGVKRSYLFDQWSSSPEEMCRLLKQIYDQGLTKVKLDLAVVTSDLLIYSRDCFLTNVDLYRHKKFIDASFLLEKPALIVEDNIVRDTLDAFSVFLQYVKNDRCDSTNSHTYRSLNSNYLWYEFDLTDVINPSSLFGLLLGYPWIYWYDRTKSDDNCLSMQPLHVFQVKGVVCDCYSTKSQREESKSNLSSIQFTHLDNPNTHHCASCVCSNDSNEKITSNEKSVEYNSSVWKSRIPNDCDNYHTLFSFSVPESILTSDLRGGCNLVEDWFSTLKSSSRWTPLFCHIWLDQKVVELPAVSL